MIGAYIRVSTASQKDNWSVDIQRDRAAKFAVAKNDGIEFYDEVRSARSLERPELSKLITDIEAGTINRVWVVEFSRLSRDVEDSAFLSKLFQKHKVELYVLDQFVDLSKSDTRFLYNINAAVNTKSSDDTSERVKRAKLRQKESGSFIHSTLYGYSHKYDETGKAIWFVNEEEANIVRRIFTQYSKGISLSKIALELNDDKIPQRRGKQWAATTVVKLLQHPEYFGLTRDDQHQLIESKVYRPLLNREDYSRLIYQKEARKEPRERFRVAKHPLSGLLQCACCGARYYPHRTIVDGKLYERFAHKNETKENQACKQKPKYFDLEKTEKLIEFIYQVTFERVDHVKMFLKSLKEEIYQTELELENTRTRVQKEFEELEVQRKRLVDAVASGSLDPGDIRDKMNEIKRLREEKEGQIQQLKEKLELFDIEYFEIGAKFSSDHLTQFTNATIDEKRKMYRYAIKDIKVRGRKVEVAFITGIRYHFSLVDWTCKEDKSGPLREYLEGRI